MDKFELLMALVRKLNNVSLLSFEDPSEALRLLSFDPDFANVPEEILWIRTAIFNNAASHFTVTKIDPPFTEADLARSFWEKLAELIPGATRVKGPRIDGPHRPDGWVQVDGECLPVEMKRGAFNGSARMQLARYMNVYGANRGVAVAPKFTCETPESVIRVIFTPA